MMKLTRGLTLVPAVAFLAAGTAQATSSIQALVSTVSDGSPLTQSNTQVSPTAPVEASLSRTGFNGAIMEARTLADFGVIKNFASAGGPDGAVASANALVNDSITFSAPGFTTALLNVRFAVDATFTLAPTAGSSVFTFNGVSLTPQGGGPDRSVFFQTQDDNTRGVEALFVNSVLREEQARTPGSDLFRIISANIEIDPNRSYTLGIDSRCAATGVLGLSICDASSSTYWGGFSLSDTQGNAISGWSLSSSSGTNWQNSFIPGEVSAAVPEPASWAMLIAGFGLVGAMQRRRRTPALA
jgi:hypothetical protein